MMRRLVVVAWVAAAMASEMLCGSGSDLPLGRLEGGSGLNALTVSLWLKSREGCAGMRGRSYVDGARAQWHEGCVLVSGIYRDTPVSLWKGQDVVWRNATSGNDFGLGLAGDGRAVFGAGYRHVPDLEGRGPHDDASLWPAARDSSVRSPGSLLDGGWHHVAATRSGEGVLRLYVDGTRVDEVAAACCVDGPVPVPKVYERVGAAVDATKRHGCCPENGFELEDAPEVLRVGQLYRGCLRVPQLLPRALDADGVRRLMSETALPDRPRFPLYFVAGDDAGSQAMRDAFVAGLKDDFDLRERRPGDVHAAGSFEGASRWLTKMRLVLKAIDDHRADPDAVAVVSDMDLTFFRPVAPVIQRLLVAKDVVFQRDTADKRDVNLGFFAFKCNARVRALVEGVVTGVALPWNDTRYELICRTGAGTSCKAPSDQYVLNRLLRRPELLAIPTTVAWGFLPLEVVTESYLKTRIPISGAFHMYFKTDNVMFHANTAAGSKKAREIKQDKVNGMLKHYEANRLKDPCLFHACW